MEMLFKAMLGACVLAPALASCGDGGRVPARFNTLLSVATDSAGNLYAADAGNSTIRRITPAGVVTTLAGAAGIKGSGDGVGADARFNCPEGVATDGAGNVYVADTFNNVIRKIAPEGVVTTLAGSGAVGSTDGPGTAASFNFPTGVATDGAGNVYVADTRNHIIRRITPAGVVTTLAGSAGVPGSADGKAARFNNPFGVAADSAGNVYVADSGNRTVRKINSAGVVITLAGSVGAVGDADGAGAAARFRLPQAVAADGTGTSMSPISTAAPSARSPLRESLPRSPGWRAHSGPPTARGRPRASAFREAWPPTVQATSMWPIPATALSARLRPPEL